MTDTRFKPSAFEAIKRSHENAQAELVRHEADEAEYTRMAEESHYRATEMRRVVAEWEDIIAKVQS